MSKALSTGFEGSFIKPEDIKQIEKRRAFAIIAHPDAGKTTLTEKLLLYGGAIQLAGHVRAKKERRSTRSDWMKLEQDRGISINTSCMQFAFEGYVLNLLDTPGHEDFSEDTYRTLMAVECAIMLIDGGKGVEPQTIKLFEICKEKQIPIITLINKLDMPAKEPFELLDNIETVLGITPVPLTWPLGSGREFKGVYDLQTQTLHRFEKTTGGAFKASEKISGIEDDELKNLMGEQEYKKFVEDVTLAHEMLPEFDEELFHSTQISPVMFASAINNFGIELLLNKFLDLAPAPEIIELANDEKIDPTDDEFTAFIFKLQANMNKAHRDRVAFARITSGIFKRGMQVNLPRLNKAVKLSSPVAFFGQERNTIDTAYPGDIIGLVNPRLYQIGDILCSGKPPNYYPLPRFAPECFARIVATDTSKLKAFKKGIDELAEEGVVQIFNADERDPIIGGIGILQLEVFKFRLEEEYGAICRLENLSYEASRWVHPEDTDKLGQFAKLVHDHEKNPVIIFESRYMLDSFMADKPDVRLYRHPVSFAGALID